MSYYYNGTKSLDRSDNYSPQGAIISISCDTALDLPTVATMQTDLGLTPIIGSTALVVDESANYMLDSAGTWHLVEQAEFKNVYTKSETDTLLQDKQDKLVIGTNLDNIVTNGSDNPVTSGAVWNSFNSLYTATVVGTNLAATASNPVDLDNITSIGVYRSESGTATSYVSNKPSELASDLRGFRLIVEQESITSYVHQTLIPAYSANMDTRIYTRHYRGTGSAPQKGWSDWMAIEGYRIGTLSSGADLNDLAYTKQGRWTCIPSNVANLVNCPTADSVPLCLETKETYRVSNTIRIIQYLWISGARFYMRGCQLNTANDPPTPSFYHWFYYAGTDTGA